MAGLPDWLRLPSSEEMARATYVSRMALRSLLKTRLPQMAAALAYRTLFGLLPISIVALVIVRMFVGDDDLKRLMEQAVRFTGIAEVIQAEVGQTTPDDPSDDAPVRPSVGGVLTMPGPFTSSMRLHAALAMVGTPEDIEERGTGLLNPPEPLDPTPQSLDDLLQGWVDNFGSVRFDAIGLVGGLVLIYAALAMVVEVERCFNQVCRAKSGRSWTRRITQYWTLMTLGAILIALTFLVSVQFREWIRAMAGDGDAFGRFIVGAAGFLVTVAISTGLLTLAYMILPNRRLRLRPTLAGATVAAIGWEAAKWGFTQYLGFSTNSTYATLYGSLALIPIFMLWVFLTWLIILFGLQVAYGVQMLEDGIEQDEDSDDPALMLAGPGLLIDAAAAIGRRFADGQGARTSDVADELALANDQCSKIINALQRGGFVKQLDNGGGFTLSKPADRIRLADIATAAPSPVASRQGSAASRLRRSAVESLGEETLQSRLAEAAENQDGSANVSKDGKEREDA
ncbi:MAG: YhjD/YihY/BrkB family envelope integrity protein [Phycisphaerales bacterium]|jgi:membrane protein